MKISNCLFIVLKVDVYKLFFSIRSNEHFVLVHWFEPTFESWTHNTIKMKKGSVYKGTLIRSEYT